VRARASSTRAAPACICLDGFVPWGSPASSRTQPRRPLRDQPLHRHREGLRCLGRPGALQLQPRATSPRGRCACCPTPASRTPAPRRTRRSATRAVAPPSAAATWATRQRRRLCEPSRLRLRQPAQRPFRGQLRAERVPEPGHAGRLDGSFPAHSIAPVGDEDWLERLGSGQPHRRGGGQRVGDAHLPRRLRPGRATAVAPNTAAWPRRRSAPR